MLIYNCIIYIGHDLRDLNFGILIAVITVLFGGREMGIEKKLYNNNALCFGERKDFFRDTRNLNDLFLITFQESRGMRYNVIVAVAVVERFRELDWKNK